MKSVLDDIGGMELWGRRSVSVLAPALGAAVHQRISNRGLYDWQRLILIISFGLLVLCYLLAVAVNVRVLKQGLTIGHLSVT